MNSRNSLTRVAAATKTKIGSGYGLGVRSVLAAFACMAGLSACSGGPPPTTEFTGQSARLPSLASAQIVAVTDARLDPLTQARLQREVALAAAATGRAHRIGSDFPPNLIIFIEDRPRGPTGLRDVDRPEVLKMRAALAGRGCGARTVGTAIVAYVPASDPPAARTACIRRIVGAALAPPPV